jgi:transposase
VDGLGAPLEERTFANDPAGHRDLAAWARRLAPDGIVGLEGSASYGAAAARFLLADGLAVREVPPQLSRREHLGTRRAGRSDPGDALAIARVTAREIHLPPVRVADCSSEIGLLVEAREDAVAESTRVRNRLHADLLVLLPGYQTLAANLVAACHRRAIRLGLRRLTGIRVELALARLARLTVIGADTRRLTARIELLLGDHPLLALPGVGVVTAAKLVAETGDVRRFRSADAFAALAGVAPIPASSGQTRHMRLNRGGNRQLNRALWTIATVQAKCHPPAKVYLARKAAEGKSRLDAIRALKRQLVRTVFRLLREGAPVLEMAA